MDLLKPAKWGGGLGGTERVDSRHHQPDPRSSTTHDPLLWRLRQSLPLAASAVQQRNIKRSCSHRSSRRHREFLHQDSPQKLGSSSSPDLGSRPDDLPSLRSGTQGRLRDHEPRNHRSDSGPHPKREGARPLRGPSTAFEPRPDGLMGHSSGLHSLSRSSLETRPFELRSLSASGAQLGARSPSHFRVWSWDPRPSPL